MTSFETADAIPALLAPPSLAERSEQQADIYLNTSFPTFKSLGESGKLQSEKKRVENELKEVESKLQDSTSALPQLLRSSLEKTTTFLSLSSSLSIERHQLVDDYQTLRDESSNKSLVSELEDCHQKLKENKLARLYLGVVERALELSEQTLSALSSSISLKDSFETYLILHQTIQQIESALELAPELKSLGLSALVRDIRDKTWDGLIKRGSDDLVKASEDISWPLPPSPTLPVPSKDQISQFNKRFLELLELQTLGKSVDAGSFGSRGHIYAIAALIKPISDRFRYHFEGERSTNRVDKPEWVFAHVLNIIHEQRGTVTRWFGPLLQLGGFSSTDPMSEFIHSILPLPLSVIMARIPVLLPHPSLLAHTIYETIVFDARIREEGYIINNGKKWNGLAEEILGRQEWFDKWLEGEKTFLDSQYSTIMMSPNAWQVLTSSELDEEDNGAGNGLADGDDNFEYNPALPNTEDRFRPTVSSKRLVELIEGITERYAPLPSLNHRFLFLITLQLPLLSLYSSRITSTLNAFESVSSSFARAVPGSLAGHTTADGLAFREREKMNGTTGLGRLVKAYLSAKWVLDVLKKWEEELFFVQLWSDIQSDNELRAQASKTPYLPPLPSTTTASLDVLIFDSLTKEYSNTMQRAEEMIIKHITQEVELDLRPHLKRRWDSETATSAESENTPFTLAPTLLLPLTTLSSHLSYLSQNFPSSELTVLYRQITSIISTHLLQREVYFGWSKFSPLGAQEFASEVEAWVEACAVGLEAKGVLEVGQVRRPEMPWKKLRGVAKILQLPLHATTPITSIEGASASSGGSPMSFSKAIQIAFDGDEASLAELGVKDLDRAELQQILKRRVDFTPS